MKAEIISIGTELLLGEIVDTNSAYLANQLPLLGIDLHFISTVGDNQRRIVETLQQACQRSDIIITTGGLGPTQDDITREAIAELLHEKITIAPNLVKTFEELFSYYKMEMPQSNIRQASVIPSAKIIPNPRGTAPGWWIEKDKQIIITMPGPPREMELMWTKEVLPRLQKLTEDTIIVSKTLKIFGPSEAKVDEMVSSFLSVTNPTLATYAKLDGIHLRITAKAHTTNKAQNMIAQREADIRKILGDHVWGTDSDSLENIVGALLIAKNLSLATIESCTGGLLANIITNVQGSSRYFKGGLITYTDEIKMAFGLDKQLFSQNNSISPEVAKAMATAAREKLGASIGVGLTGITGPHEIEGKPVGTIFISIDDGQHQHGSARNYPGNRLQVKQRAVTWALLELRRFLL